jgi:hypothetical protein
MAMKNLGVMLSAPGFLLESKTLIMTRFLYIFGLVCLPCCKITPESPGAKPPSYLYADFEAESWRVRLSNKGDARILTGIEFFSIEITSESRDVKAQSVRGVLGDYESYVLISPKGDRHLELSDDLRHPSSKYECKLYYIDDLNEAPRTFEFSFDSPDR